MGLCKVLASGAKLTPPGWMTDNPCYETIGLPRGYPSAVVAVPDEPVQLPHPIAELTARYR